MSEQAVQKQREYYAATADDYDRMHLQHGEHEFALAQLSGLLAYYKFDSLLDVGAGTGRVLRHARKIDAAIRIKGIEPVPELIEIGYRNGIARDELEVGDAMDLPFESDSWDVVCAFGILHHIPQPNKAIREMCRVARHAVFFSDLNNYGCGSLPQRLFAQTLRALHLWRGFQWIKNGGRFDKYSKGDGVHFSYSLFDSLDTIKEKFPQTFLSNTRGSASSIYRGCSHMSAFAVRSTEDLQALSRNSPDDVASSQPLVGGLEGR